MSEGKIKQGDCVDLINNLDDGSVDFVLTSPPYKNSYEGIGMEAGEKKEKFHYNNDVGEPLYTVIDMSEALYKKIKDDGVYLLNLGYNNDTGFLRPYYIVERLLKNDWFCADSIIWHKKNPIPNTAKQLTKSFAFIFILTKRPTYKLDVDSKIYEHNVWDIGIASNKSEKHNAAFPMKLAEKSIDLFTSEGDLVLDPMVGTGTTCIAAKKLNRDYLGFDINKEYVELARKNLSKQEPPLDSFEIYGKKQEGAASHD